VRKLWCWIVGHDVEPTGRSPIVLHQMRCRFCQGLFCWGDVPGQNGLLPWSWSFEFFFRENER
jgi:hypothetical protein